MDGAAVAALITAGTSLLITILSLARQRRADDSASRQAERTIVLAEWEAITRRLSGEVKRLGEGLEECLTDKNRMARETAALRKRIDALERDQREPPSSRTKPARP